MGTMNSVALQVCGDESYGGGGGATAHLGQGGGDGGRRGRAWDERSAALQGAVLLVNATSLGMKGQPTLEIELDALSPHAVVNDIVYAPLETPLLAAARAGRRTVVDGLGMLLQQARPAFDAWFGEAPELSEGLRRFVLER